MSHYTKYWTPYQGENTPEKTTISVKSYSTSPALYLPVQPPNLPQFLPVEALEKGTLWKYYYDPYISPLEGTKE